MHNLILWLLIIGCTVAFFVYLSSWFSAIETALIHLTGAQIAEMKRTKAQNIKYIIRLKKNMDCTLVTILIGNNFVNILLSSIVTLIANALFQKIGVSIMVAFITLTIIIFGEITPKSHAIMHTKKVVMKNAKILSFLVKLFKPLISIFIYVSEIILKLGGAQKAELKHLLVSDENIKELVSLSEEQGLIKKIEKDIIHKVFPFGDCKIETIMLPMSKVFLLQNGLSIMDAAKIVAKRGFTRVPVLNDKKEIIGILYAKDLLRKKSGVIGDVMRDGFFVPAKSDVTTVFKQMKKRRTHIAIVQDSNENSIGIVTLEDILEELVGEIDDEYSKLQDQM